MRGTIHRRALARHSEVAATMTPVAVAADEVGVLVAAAVKEGEVRAVVREGEVKEAEGLASGCAPSG